MFPEWYISYMKKTSLLISLTLVLSHLLHAVEKLPKVYLNQVSVVLDDVTFKGIIKSDFIQKKFANVDAGMPKFGKANDTVNAIYVRGKNTYVQILNSKNPYGMKEGQIALGFSAEQINGAKQLHDSLFAASAFRIDSVSVNGNNVASATVFNLSATDAAFNYFFSDYHPDVMQALYKQNFKSKPIKRSDFLKKRYSVDRLFNDITEISLQLSKTETSPFVEVLKQLDFNVSEKNNNYVAKGNDIVIRIKVSEEVIPKLQLKLKMNAPKDGNYNLNNSKLDFDGSYGTWNFY